ncbi:MAG: DUF4382 domain-containing protein [Gammaproteobacteria bacterium]|nr:DUF4382 domain-containing protein [Gammaproteobacteria bacterium]MDH3536725.1 DUF4382 domain-containing protein [Gammaproteobacteria bacterium]
MVRTIKLISSLALAASLAACGTDTGSGDRGSLALGPSTPGVTVTTSDGSNANRSGFSLRLTDAPIDGLSQVILQFTEIELKPERGGWIRYTLPKPRPIDLLALHGLTTADLLVNMPIEPGVYKQLRFLVDDAPMANKIVMKGGGVKNLEVPDGSSVGLRINQKFTIPEDRLVNFTVDFDLRKSVNLNRNLGLYKFKAKMRLVVDSDVGFVRGSVDPALLIGPGCSDADVDTHNAVYVYSGHNAATDDINELSTTKNEPVTTTPIMYDSASGLYIYEAAFLPQDAYTVAFTCNADLDDNETDDILPFFFTRNVNVLVTDKTFLKP